MASQESGAEKDRRAKARAEFEAWEKQELLRRLADDEMYGEIERPTVIEWMFARKKMGGRAA